MRRTIVFLLLLGVLAGLLAARAALPDPAVPAIAYGETGFHVLDLALPGEEETAGSGMLGEISRWLLSRTPTAKNAFTGALEGRDLLLIAAPEWAPDPLDRDRNPALARLARESAALTGLWQPDWYQGDEGRLFALLSGLVPTRVNDRSALAYTGERRLFLPYALPRVLGRMGYTSLALAREESCRAGLEALGFTEVQIASRTPADTAEVLLAALEGETPRFLFALWSGDGEDALARLLEAIDSDDRRQDTVLCLLTGDPDPERAQLYLWGAGLSGAASDLPCSEPDLLPTLLNLLGADFDARLLVGRDILAPTENESAPQNAPIAALYGTAFSDWVTEAGLYRAAEGTFLPFGEDPRPLDRADYIRTVSRRVWEDYVYSRRILEYDYFRRAFSGRE